MKHSVLRITAVLLATLLLAGCGGTDAPSVDPEKTDTVDFSTDYHIITLNDAERDRTFVYKINVKTGSYTLLCDDPVCKHDSDECLASCITGQPVRLGNLLYFIRLAGSPDDRELLMYRKDLAGGKTDLLLRRKASEDEPRFSSNFCATGKYLYFFEREIPDGSAVTLADDPAYDPLNHLKYEILRYDLGSGEMKLLGKAEDLLGYDSSANAQVLSFDDSTVKWSTPNGYIVVTDYDLHMISSEQIKNEDRSKGKTFPKFGRNYITDESTHFGYVSLYLVDGGEQKLLESDMGNYVFDEEAGKIYFTKYHDEPTVISTKEESGYIRDIVDETCGEIYVMDPDGSDKHLLCKIEDDTYKGSRTAGFEPTDPICVGDCFLVPMTCDVVVKTKNQFTNGEEQVDLQQRSHHGMAIVNAITGEYKVVYPEWQPEDVG